jgi:beta-glucosidase
LRRELLTLPYLDPSLPKEDRAADLVSRVTLEEEVSGMLNSSAAVPRQLPFPVP